METIRQSPMGVTIGQEEIDDYRQVPERLLGFPLDHVIEYEEPAPCLQEPGHVHRHRHFIGSISTGTSEATR